MSEIQQRLPPTGPPHTQPHVDTSAGPMASSPPPMNLDNKPPQSPSQPNSLVDSGHSETSGDNGKGLPNGTSSANTSIPAIAPSTVSHEEGIDGDTINSHDGNVTDESGNPAHPNAKTTSLVTNGTTTTKTNISSPVCRNCKTQTTPLWRRDETGQVLCNACGLFLKLHGRPRPISLKTDTIKSRNRIKQSGGNSNKSTAPNTPKLESKDSKPITSTNGGNTSRPKSPKLKKKDTITTANTPMQLTVSSSGGTQSQFHAPHLPNYNHHLQNHLSHQVQPLHYPSSTPTQFAPGLQRITSPLLLSTTSSISNTRNNSSNPENNKGNSAANSIQQAAGALENMSNELGPSATFKSSKVSTPMSLINNKPTSIKKEPSPVFSTPSSALNNNPKPINSPSFGPQFHLNSTNSNPSSKNGSQTPETSLPPIQQVASVGKPALPHIQNIASPPIQDQNQPPAPHSQSGPISHSGNPQGPHSSPNQSFNYSSSNNGNNGLGSNRESNDQSQPSHNNSSNHGNNPNDNNPGDSNKNSGQSEEVTVLKTRISELELVNDLYRTRIMELEAMEQAARLRETSIRKRLDEIISLQEGNDAKRTRYE